MKKTTESLKKSKKMVLYFRDLSLFYLDWYDLSKRKTKQHRENVDYHAIRQKIFMNLGDLKKLIKKIMKTS